MVYRVSPNMDQNVLKHYHTPFDQQCTEAKEQVWF